ncbi:MAG: 2TM domain-containing protein [Dehalococcoidia bacterium]|nr:2TM domain-containing protein [Dehalococcoidia bacterium]
MSSQMSEEQIRSLAESRVEKKKGFFIHLFIYLAINVMLVIIWAVTGSPFPWFVFPLAGWGIGLLFHCLSVFAFPQAGSDWERKEIQKEMDRLRKNQ